MNVFKPGNYSVKFREYAARMMGSPLLSQADKAGLSRVVSSLASAIHFGLPDCGVILPRKAGMPLPDVRDIIRPPFPETVLEYSAVNGGFKPGAPVASSKRIVLALEAEDGDQTKATLIIPIIYIDQTRSWVLPHIGFAILQDATDPRGLNQIGGMTVFPKPIMPDYFLLNERQSKSHPSYPVGVPYENILAADAADEISAYIDFVQALSCSNVQTETVQASRALNTSRVKSKKPKLFDYKILTLGEPKDKSDGTGIVDRRSPRSHLRRGHIRNLASGKRTWINAAFIRGSGDGFVHKDYQVAPRHA